MPVTLLGKKYYNPKDTSSYEKYIKDYLDLLNKLEHKKREN
jgi:hypothetical protein